MQRSDVPSVNFIRRIRPWMVTLLVCLVYVTVIYFANDQNPLTFIQPAVGPSAEHPEGWRGYDDGKAVYYLAVDWRTAAQHVDVPAYRFQRILLPIIAWLLSFGGQPAILPFVLVGFNTVALSASVYLLETLLEAEHISRWYALVYGLFAGLLMPVRLSLTEPLAYGLVIAAIWLERRDRLVGSAIVFALAGLTKEPTLIFTAGYILWMLFEGRWRDALRLGIIAWTPFVLWQGVLYLWLGSFGVGTGGGGSTPFEIFPYMGFLRIYLVTGSLPTLLALGAAFIPFSIYPSIWGMVNAIRDLVRRVWHPYSFLLLVNAAVIMITPFSTFREPLGIIRFVPGLILCVLLYSAHFRRRGMLRFSLAWFYSLAWLIASV